MSVFSKGNDERKILTSPSKTKEALTRQVDSRLFFLLSAILLHKHAHSREVVHLYLSTDFEHFDAEV